MTKRLKIEKGRNIFRDLGFPPGETQNLIIRAELNDHDRTVCSQDRAFQSGCTGKYGCEERNMNQKRMILLFIIFLSPGVVLSKEKLTSLVPLKVVSVERARVNDRLVRTILYDTDTSAQLDIELIKTPEMTTLIDRRVVKKIDIAVSGKREVLNFADSAATSINNIRIDDGFVKFDVEFFVRVRGDHYLSTCTVDVNKDVLPEPMCQLVKQNP